jgi:uncharacterized protein (DUF885 family)
MRHFVVAVVALAWAASSPALASESFAQLADRYWDEELARNPAFATQMGVHRYDDKLYDLSAAAIQKYAAAQKEWLRKLGAVDATRLSASDAIDLEIVKHQARAAVVDIEVVRRWRRLPRYYAEPAVSSVYLLVKRNFAPLDERMKSVIARESAVPKLVAAAKQNLSEVDPINIELALTELPANIDFLQQDTVQAFATVKDAALHKQLTASTKTATDALAAYGAWLRKDLLPRAKGHFAIGAAAFAQKLSAEEGIDEPLDAVLARGEAELKRLREEFVATAKKIDPAKPAPEVQASLAADHPKAATLIADVQARLAGLREFLVDKAIVTIPSTVMPIVQESPPFMRAFTLASMDTPGPFEAKATEAYYNVTLPDPKWSAAEVESYLRGGFSRTIIEMVSIHEAFPGHYVQFLWMPQMKSRTRKMYGCSSNAEGWAHYSEQMMIDEGAAGADPKQRLAQLQEALLRAARYVVGIKMHTRGMSLQDGMALFEREGLQSKKVAEMEAKRGTEDPTYLYYTYGKLEILKLRDEYKRKLGAQYSLRKFHDAFLAEGAIPLSLTRKILLAP